MYKPKRYTGGIRSYIHSKVYDHDVTEIPWPIEDKKYDLLIALQTFEHLGGKETEAFQEIKRIAKHAILSLPCKLNSQKNPFLKWVKNEKPICTSNIPISGENGASDDRIVCLWKFT